MTKGGDICKYKTINYEKREGKIQDTIYFPSYSRLYHSKHANSRLAGKNRLTRRLNRILNQFYFKTFIIIIYQGRRPSHGQAVTWGPDRYILWKSRQGLNSSQCHLLQLFSNYPVTYNKGRMTCIHKPGIANMQLIQNCCTCN